MNDSQFNIKIKDYRAISEADIDINGITVLSGVNGCGKSSIALLTYEFFYSSIHTELILKNSIINLFREPLELIEEFIVAVSSIINDNELIDLKRSIQDFYSKWNNNEISIYNLTWDLPIIINNTRQLYIDNKEMIYSNKEVNLKVSRISRLLINYMFNSNISLKNIGYDFEDIFELLRENISSRIEVLNVDESSFPSIITSERLRKLYSENTLPTFIEIKEFDLSLFSYPNKKSSIKVHSIENIFYVDSPLILEADSKLLNNNNHWKYLREQLKTNINQNTANITIDDLFKNNLQILNIEHSETFEETFNFIRSDGKEYKLAESATGIKSFALLRILYQKGMLNKRTLLILDEPEVHLHPQWVVEYARLVVLLNRYLGVKFLIASHHPEFVSSIKYISEKEQTTEGLNFYIAKEVEDFKYKYKSTGTEIDDTFISFNKSYDLIDKYGDNEI